ncbi:hypothetical protein ACWEWU_13900 [Staphylococcus xylosus]
MHDFNYNNTKELHLNTTDVKNNKEKIEWIYANYENIILEIQMFDAPWLIMNGYQIARIKNFNTSIKDLEIEFNFTNNTPIYVTFRD